ncbi:unnamed protein product [marine sediment metagenome]|uniref:Uncharacterized protein n=1 Tax=marine sediment metagenome TaxID=412755 RepID=X0ZPR7_9ZZZZ
MSPTGKQIFEALKSKRIIRLVKDTYYGKAADGKYVQLGYIGMEYIIYNYLEDRPSPAQW